MTNGITDTIVVTFLIWSDVMQEILLWVSMSLCIMAYSSFKDNFNVVF